MGSSGGSKTPEPPPGTDSVAGGVDPDRVLYAQCWEDADVLVEALGIRPRGTYLSVASAGDNTLALLTRDPGRVVAVDVSPAQLACLDLRVAAYGRLDHDELLELIGSRPSTRREELYAACRDALESEETRAFWDARRDAVVEHGLGGVGRFEGYFRVFRRLVLPLIHGRATVHALLEPRTRDEREEFYEAQWDTVRWRAMVRGFFSRRVMSWLGREPAFFAHAHESLSEHVLRRARHALVELDPSRNPYLRWILTGRHGDALPLALRPESHAAIRRNLGCLEVRRASVEDCVRAARRAGERFDGFNLSDVFEYMPPDRYLSALRSVIAAGAPGARLVYWNMLVPRSCPRDLADRLEVLAGTASRLHGLDRAFFYSRLRVEAVR